ncbi:MAG: hypothetical protein ACREEK_29885 [Bradyrhizobium sp.]
MNWLLNRWWVSKLMNQFGSGAVVFVSGCVLLLGVAFPSISLGDLNHALTDIFGTIVILTTVAQGAAWLWRRRCAPG